MLYVRILVLLYLYILLFTFPATIAQDFIIKTSYFFFFLLIQCIFEHSNIAIILIILSCIYIHLQNRSSQHNVYSEVDIFIKKEIYLFLFLSFESPPKGGV